MGRTCTYTDIHLLCCPTFASRSVVIWINSVYLCCGCYRGCVTGTAVLYKVRCYIQYIPWSIVSNGVNPACPNLDVQYVLHFNGACIKHQTRRCLQIGQIVVVTQRQTKQLHNMQYDVVRMYLLTKHLLKRVNRKSYVLKEYLWCN